MTTRLQFAADVVRSEETHNLAIETIFAEPSRRREPTRAKKITVRPVESLDDERQRHSEVRERARALAVRDLYEHRNPDAVSDELDQARDRVVALAAAFCDGESSKALLRLAVEDWRLVKSRERLKALER